MIKNIVFLTSIVFYANAVPVVIKPDTDTSGLGITAKLSNDPRSINEINNDNEWKIYQSYNKTLSNWGIVLTLDARQYAFRNKDGSSISISIDGTRESEQCDGYFAFSIDDKKYFTFVTDFDGNYNANFGNGPERNGIFVYPSCGSNSIVSGNPSGLIPSVSDISITTIRNAMTEGDQENFHLFSSIPNGPNFPIKFELINNKISNKFIFKFSSPTFTTPIQCIYNSAVDIDKDFKLYISNDGGDEEMHIKSFTVNGQNVGLEGCDLDINSYLDRCYCKK